MATQPFSLTAGRGWRDASVIQIGQRGDQIFTVYRLGSRHSDAYHMIAVRVRPIEPRVSSESQASIYELAARIERFERNGASWALCVDGAEARLHIEDTTHTEAQNAEHLGCVLRALRGIGVV